MAKLFGVTNADISYHLIQLDKSGEVHLSDAIRIIRIPSEQWDEQGVTLYNLMLHKQNTKAKIHIFLPWCYFLLYATAQDTPSAAPTAANIADARFHKNFIILDLFSLVIFS